MPRVSVAVVEQIMSSACGGAVRLDAVDDLGGSDRSAIGHVQLYQRLRERLGPRDTGRLADRYERRNYARLTEALHNATSALKIVPSDGVNGELHTLNEHMADPGAFLAYTHRDACPDNIVRANGALKLLDFEFGGYGPALIDGVYGRMHFPSCRCVNCLPTEQYGQLRALGATVRQMSGVLSARWLPDLVPLTYYPAFRTSLDGG